MGRRKVFSLKLAVLIVAVGALGGGFFLAATEGPSDTSSHPVHDKGAAVGTPVSVTTVSSSVPCKPLGLPTGDWFQITERDLEATGWQPGASVVGEKALEPLRRSYMETASEEAWRRMLGENRLIDANTSRLLEEWTTCNKQGVRAYTATTGNIVLVTVALDNNTAAFVAVSQTNTFVLPDLTDVIRATVTKRGVPVNLVSRYGAARGYTGFSK